MVGLITPSMLTSSPRYLSSFILLEPNSAKIKDLPSDDSSSTTFAIFGFACLGAAQWAWARVPETAGVSLEEIDVLFASEAGREDARLRQEVSRREHNTKYMLYSLVE